METGALKINFKKIIITLRMYDRKSLFGRCVCNLIYFPEFSATAYMLKILLVSICRIKPLITGNC